MRRDLGNVRGLADSIARVGLLHAVVVTPDGRLVSGARRLAAVRLLGWDTVPVRTVGNLTDALPLLIAERDENVERKAFTPEEAVDMAAALEPLEREAAKARQAAAGPTTGPGKKSGSGNFPEAVRGEARDKVARAVGLSAPTLRKAREVVEAARADDRFLPALQRMNATGNVDRARKEVQRGQAEKLVRGLRANLPPVNRRYRILRADVRNGLPEVEDASVDYILTDPPYPREYLPLYESLAKVAARALKPGGSCLVMVGQSYLPEVLALMMPHLRYHWCLSYLTPGGQSVQLWERKVNTFWKPVLWFVRGDHAGDWVGDVARSDVNENDKRFHKWGQSESGIADLMRRFTRVGDTILDPFVGGGTMAVVALATDRRVIGADCDQAAVDTTLNRIAELEIRA
jgi:site-specific DNA-methyltransferase (adenine-specific)